MAEGLIGGLSSTPEVAVLCCVLLKKYFLDPRSTANLSPEDLERLKASVEASFDFENQPLHLLKRKGDVLSKLYSKLNKKQELLQWLTSQCSNESAKVRQFAMYVLETLSEVELSSEELSGAKDQFTAIFSQALQDSEVQVRVAALQAVSAFLSGIDDTAIALSFAQILPTLVDVIVDALRNDEDQGRKALESLCELTSAHPEVWKTESYLSKLLNVVSEITQTT